MALRGQPALNPSSHLVAKVTNDEESRPFMKMPHMVSGILYRLSNNSTTAISFLNANSRNRKVDGT